MSDQTVQATKPFAVTLDAGSSLLNKTGSWRTERPIYVDRLPPCNQACPAGENIQAWLYHAEEGNYRAAWQELMKNNPLPAIMGRACYHPCQDSCNRAKLDSTVNIHAVERFLGRPGHPRGVAGGGRGRPQRRQSAGHRRRAQRPVRRLSSGADGPPGSLSARPGRWPAA